MAILSPPDNMGEGNMFSACSSSVLSVHVFVRSFVRTDLVTTITHERLERSRRSLPAILTGP